MAELRNLNATLLRRQRAPLGGQFRVVYRGSPWQNDLASLEVLRFHRHRHWLPKPWVLHPHPNERFYAKYPK